MRKEKSEIKQTVTAHTVLVEPVSIVDTVFFFILLGTQTHTSEHARTYTQYNTSDTVIVMD